MTIKKKIRQEIKRKRASLSLEEVRKLSNRICTKICDLPIFSTSTTIFLYSSIGNEVDTTKILETALQNNKTVAYPSTNTTSYTMEFYKINGLGDLRPVQSGNFHLLEPVQNKENKIIPGEHSLMIVPGLAFDHQFYRIGYGGGFYDKYLALYPNLKTIGVCYDFQTVQNTYPDMHDKAVNMVITENGEMI